MDRARSNLVLVLLRILARLCRMLMMMMWWQDVNGLCLETER